MIENIMNNEEKISVNEYLDNNDLLKVSYIQYEQKNGEIKTTYIIPEGYYFVMGDHRDVSIDSRRIGLVHEKNIEVVHFCFKSTLVNSSK